MDHAGYKVPFQPSLGLVLASCIVRRWQVGPLLCSWTEVHISLGFQVENYFNFGYPAPKFPFNIIEMSVTRD
jgi:hypothetical protein